MMGEPGEDGIPGRKGPPGMKVRLKMSACVYVCACACVCVCARVYLCLCLCVLYALYYTSSSTYCLSRVILILFRVKEVKMVQKVPRDQ